MRKSLLFGAMLLIASCTVYKEEEFESPLQHRYHAVAEEPVNVETRVYADSKLRVRWNEGDHISIFERDTYNQEYEFLGDTGDTAGDFDLVESSGYHSSGDIEDGHVYAVYPYEKKNKCDYEGKLTVTFPSTQHYKKDSFGVGANVMVARTNTLDLRFMHVGGYRTFKLFGEGVSVSSVRIESNGPEYLAGRTDVVIGEDGKPAVSFIESTSNSKSVELVCDTPVALGATASEAVEFWFVLPPGTLTQGFTVTITDENGKEFTKSTSNTIEIKSGVKKSMPALEVEIENEPVVPVPEAVDLGLPSGLKWASFNLGASVPEEYGDYYAWGETEPKVVFTNDNYQWWIYTPTESQRYTILKYLFDGGWTYTVHPNETPDYQHVIYPEDDAATVQFGGEWRIPTSAEAQELINYCDWTWETYNGKSGYRVKSRVEGYSNESIFMPLTGYMWQSFNDGTSDYGIYWLADLIKDDTLEGYSLHVYNPSHNSSLKMVNGNVRSQGSVIRPVFGKRKTVTSIKVNKNELEMKKGKTTYLNATITPSDAPGIGIIWKSSDESIVTVTKHSIPDYSVQVEAIASGEATIIAVSVDSGVQATCHVSVVE